MGKRLISQARGRGGPKYTSPKHRFKGKPTYHSSDKIQGTIKDFIKCPGHNAPLIQVTHSDNKKTLLVAAEGIRVGQTISYKSDAEIIPGNVLKLKDIPEGTKIFGIENRPGDNGKFCKAPGAFARVLSKTKNKVTIQFPSKKVKECHKECRASIGVVAGGGVSEKPILKAGTRYKMRRAKKRLYPSVSGTSMNAVDHPFGGTTSSRKGRPTVTPRGAPPGRKVGMLRARRTGRRKGKKV